MRIVGFNESWTTLECDVLIVPLFSDDDLSHPTVVQVDELLAGQLRELIDSKEWKGKAGDTLNLVSPRRSRIRRILLLGLGKRQDFDLAGLRKSLLTSLRRLNRPEIGRLAVIPRLGSRKDEACRATIEGVVLGTFNPGLHKSSNSDATRIEELVLIGKADEAKCPKLQLDQAAVLARATNFARDLVYQPSNHLGPARFCEIATEMAEATGLSSEVLELDQLREQGMNSILAVAQGGGETPRLLILEYRGSSEPKSAPIALVGKGVTFDSGGLSLKPAQAMEDMKVDKAGACAVLGAMKAVAELKFKTDVVALIPLVENMPGPLAQKPGDVIYSLSGKTVEVLNTDAEGRLILADALTYAIRRFSPSCMIDIATLTGACVVALGQERAGYFANSDGLAQELERASTAAGEKIWRLPLDPVYRDALDSKIADIKNIGGRWGGAITAAKFLQEFVEDVPWGHIDMAGVDLFTGSDGLGPTGFGVRSLAHFVRGRES
ncbi:MAG: leucyl aminopeptidase [Acidobacteriota bacterium]|nr:MAG: leucyl aminopeptidase [Acidobacteriota bacterium]